ncbi:MAG: radical SAM protein, partial [Desulfurococcales archaeon]|nr:radical SAM protein [Desulfurococcales archaeon]
LTHRAGRDKVIAYTYLDPLPTNCVATPVCPGATGRGYPRYTNVRGPEYGFYNLAVFMGGCPLDCAFCQNWEHKAMVSPQAAQGLAMAGYHALTPLVSMDVEELVDKAMDDKVRCICYFGGDPTPQTPQLIRASRRILQQSQGIKRICWETDGLVNPALMKEMARASLESGGIVKIDWKAWTPELYEALTGVDGYKAHERLKENTRIVAEMAGKRREPPLLVVSILLVPGYVGPGEVYKVSRYIASLNRETPLVLLAFHPQYLMQDLPPTSIDHMKKAIEQAERAGIKEVYIGNEWLLKDTYKVEDWWDPG